VIKSVTGSLSYTLNKMLIGFNAKNMRCSPISTKQLSTPLKILGGYNPGKTQNFPGNFLKGISTDQLTRFTFTAIGPRCPGSTSKVTLSFSLMETERLLA